MSNRFVTRPGDLRRREKTVAQIIGEAHQVILNAPRKKDAADLEAMRLLEVAYARLEDAR